MTDELHGTFTHCYMFMYFLNTSEDQIHPALWLKKQLWEVE